MIILNLGWEDSESINLVIEYCDTDELIQSGKQDSTVDKQKGELNQINDLVKLSLNHKSPNFNESSNINILTSETNTVDKDTSNIYQSQESSEIECKLQKRIDKIDREYEHSGKCNSLDIETELNTNSGVKVHNKPYSLN